MLPIGLGGGGYTVGGQAPYVGRDRQGRDVGGAARDPSGASRDPLKVDGRERQVKRNAWREAMSASAGQGIQVMEERVFTI